MENKKDTKSRKKPQKYYTNVQVTCSCGNVFTIGGATKEFITTEFCNKCHPAYTGTKNIVDTANRVKRFEEKMKKSKVKQKVAKAVQAKKAARTKEKEKKKEKGEVTLKDILKDMGKTP